jgi:multidrug efflux system membrane fusion protein
VNHVHLFHLDLRLTCSVLLVAAAVSLPACRKGGEPGPAGGAPRAGGGPSGAGPGGGGRKPAKFPVEVAPVAARAVEYAVNAVGSIEAFEVVQVTARVPGAVERVRFSEGQKISTGGVLVEIEPQRYKLEVEAARAALEKTRAAETDAQAGVDRREKAVATTPGLIPGEEIESWRTRQRTAAADVAEKKAAHAQAELNLRDAYVRAPVAGLIETRRVQTGQYVQPGTVLATLVRREPLLLRFSVPAPEAASLRTGQKARFTIREQGQGYEARITHVAGAADTTSRMVVVTAEVLGNAKENLRPGAFAEVVIPVQAPREAPILPPTAVRPTERGFVAFVVENNVARERILTLGMRTADGSVEVRSGIKAGETVVVRGAEALRDGAAVAVERQGPPRAERPPDPKKLAP